MDKLLREPGYQSDTLGDVQEFLKEMLEMYHYEETLMNSTTQAIHSDIHNLQFVTFVSMLFYTNLCICALNSKHVKKTLASLVCKGHLSLLLNAHIGQITFCFRVL